MIRRSQMPDSKFLVYTKISPQAHTQRFSAEICYRDKEEKSSLGGPQSRTPHTQNLPTSPSPHTAI
ncbi:hypothetical protein [Pontibacter sp. G13]|uniref:hypothetical protein n=1 Tax=Pontibacter sp. G13 TaxID=3074898 RepID=UPI00288976DC|nr:hypothetical protein [Pontibacter sp. G13]WNJ17041.1 hypothetical protein RJD25_19475 [Pontibacter sp. G13]